MKRWRIWLGLVVLVLLAGAVGHTVYKWWIQFPVRRIAAAQVVQPQRMTLVREVPAFGRVQAPEAISVDFDTAGTITSVEIQEGQTVVAGQVVAQLDQVAFRLVAASAREDVVVAQANLALLQRQPSAEDIAVLQAAVDVAKAEVGTAEALVQGARASLAAATAGSTPEEIAIAEGRVEDAKAALWGAQSQRDAVCGRVDKGGSAADCDSAEAAVSRAEQAQHIAELQLEQLQSGVRAEDIAPYQAQVQQSLGNLDTARAGLAAAEAAVAQALQAAQPEAVSAAEAALSQAQVALSAAERELGLTVLVAPVEGVVTSLLVSPGQTVNAGQTVAQIVEIAQTQPKVLVNERFIGQVAVGQSARVRLEALSDDWLPATVQQVAETRSSTAGGANYEVTLALDQQPAALREGLAVEAYIETGRSIEALTLPREVLRADDAGWYVEAVDGSRPVRVDVTLGLSQGRQVEITEGLEEETSVLIAGTSLGTEQGDYSWMPFGLFRRVN